MLLSILYLFLLQLKVSAAEPVIALKVEDIKNLVETRNERVTSKSYQESAMESRQGYLKRSFFPTLRVYGAQERFELGSQYRRTQPTYGAEMSVNLFNGTKDKLNDDMIDKKKERIQTEKKVTLYHEVIRAKEIYWTVIYLDKIVDSLNQIKDLNRKNLTSAQKRIRAGVTTKADSFEFEIKNTEMERDIAQAVMQRKMLLRELGVLLGYEEGADIKLIGDLQHMESMERIESHSEIQHQFLAKPSLVQAEENEMEAKMQARSWWPRVDAYVAQNQYNVRTGNVFDRQEGKETVT